MAGCPATVYRTAAVPSGLITLTGGTKCPIKGRFHPVHGSLCRVLKGIMLKSRNTQLDVASELVSRRRYRRLAATATKYKRLFALSSTILVALSIVLLGFIMTTGPERVALGEGKAGVVDISTVADTIAGDTTDATQGADVNIPRASAEEPDNELPEGEASYYGNELAGRPTASGERFDPEGLTAAHRTLPFGTRLRVTNVSNGKSVIVRVNDRGPFSGNRVLDLSHSAARNIGMLRRGEARVRMEVLK